VSEPLVVDASVAVKWYVPEVHTEVALRFLDEQYELLVPGLFFPEFGNVVWKKQRTGEISVEEARAIVGAMDKVSFIVYPSENLLRPAFEIAVGLDRSVYDSVYLSLAVLRNCRMLTADRKFYRAIQKNGEYAANVRWVEE